MGKTLIDFLNENNITMKAKHVDVNPNMADWTDANHYCITLYFEDQKYTAFFSQGYGISGYPTIERVVETLAQDASAFENSSGFSDFCSNFDYDEDSREAFAIYEAIEKQSANLLDFLGDDLYEELLWEVES